jgi:hypothetical protein
MARRKLKAVKVGVCQVFLSKEGGKYVVQTRCGNAAVTPAVRAETMKEARSETARQVRFLRKKIYR